jgi:hypothetical protein
MPKKLTLNEISLKVKEKLNPQEWSLLKVEKSKNLNKTKIILVHQCGNKKETNYAYFFKDKCGNTNEIICDACSKQKIKKEKYLKYKKIAKNNNLKFLSKFKNFKDFSRKTYITIKCLICGHIYQSTGNNVQQNKGCPVCANKKRFKNLNKYNPKKNINIFREEVSKLEGNDYIVLSNEYINNKEKLEFKHTLCNNTFFMRPNDFQQGYRCPFCAKKNQTGILHKKIESLLEVLSKYFNLSLLKEVNLKERLRCDFLIDNTYIEIDGSQHFYLNESSNWTDIETTRRRDQKKNKFILKNKLRLLRIPFSANFLEVSVFLINFLLNKKINKKIIKKNKLLLITKTKKIGISKYYDDCRQKTL